MALNKKILIKNETSTATIYPIGLHVPFDFYAFNAPEPSGL